MPLWVVVIYGYEWDDDSEDYGDCDNSSEDEIEVNIETTRKQTKFCDINITAVVLQQEWQSFKRSCSVFVVTGKT